MFFGKFTIIVILIILYFTDQSLQQCLCNVKRNGEYCGTELNRINSNSDCGKNIYMCGKANKNQTAVILKTCAQGRECDVRIRRSNACLRSVNCRCEPELLTTGGRGPYCGSQLGGDCGPNVIFICRWFGRPKPINACPNGCSNGKCSDTAGPPPEQQPGETPGEPPGEGPGEAPGEPPAEPGEPGEPVEPESENVGGSTVEVERDTDTLRRGNKTERIEPKSKTQGKIVPKNKTRENAEPKIKTREDIEPKNTTIESIEPR